MKVFVITLALLFTTVGVRAQDGSFAPFFFEQDTLYSMTPTEGMQEGFHLWVWKPTYKSNMPIKHFDRMENKIAIDPLKRRDQKEVMPKPYDALPREQMPNPFNRSDDPAGFPNPEP